MTRLLTGTTGYALAASSLFVLVCSVAQAGPPVGEDFNAGNAENWQPDDPLKNTFGPTTFGIDNGAYRLTTQPLPPIPQFVGAGSGFVPSMVDPESYSDGTVRAKVRFHNENTNASIFVRTTGSGGVGTGYSVFLNNFEDFIGIADIAAPGGNIAGTNYPLEVGVDYMVEGRFVGSEISIKVWPHGDPKPAEPQVSIFDSMYPDGGYVALVVYNQSSNSGGTGGTGGVLDVSFDDFSFTPDGTNLVDDFTAGADDWLILHNLDGVGGPSTEIIDAEFHLASNDSVPAGSIFWTTAGLIDSIENPEYVHGVYQTKFRLSNDVSSASLVIRDSGAGDAGSQYLFIVEQASTPGLANAGIVRRVDGPVVWQEIVTIVLDLEQDYYLEATAIGDDFALKVWPTDVKKPDSPLVTATDSNWDPSHTGMAILSYRGQFAPAGAFSSAFSYVWFTPDCLLADLNCDGVVNVLDLLILLEAWGDCPQGEACPADLNGDGTVNVLDLLILLENWG